MCSKIWVIAQSGKEASNERTDLQKWAMGYTLYARLNLILMEVIR